MSRVAGIDVFDSPKEEGIHRLVGALCGKEESDHGLTLIPAYLFPLKDKDAPIFWGGNRMIKLISLSNSYTDSYTEVLKGVQANSDIAST